MLKLLDDISVWNLAWWWLVFLYKIYPICCGTILPRVAARAMRWPGVPKVLGSFPGWCTVTCGVSVALCKRAHMQKYKNGVRASQLDLKSLTTDCGHSDDRLWWIWRHDGNQSQLGTAATRRCSLGYISSIYYRILSSW